MTNDDKRVPLRIAALSVAILLSGCGAEVSFDEAPAVQLGTGELGFEPLGGELPLLVGPQGGLHFIVNARIRGLLPGDASSPRSPQNPRTTFRCYDDDGQGLDAGLGPHVLGYVREGDDSEWHVLASSQFLIVGESTTTELIGRDVRLEVIVEDADGVSAYDERWVTVR